MQEGGVLYWRNALRLRCVRISRGRPPPPLQFRRLQGPIPLSEDPIRRQVRRKRDRTNVQQRELGSPAARARHANQTPTGYMNHLVRPRRCSRHLRHQGRKESRITDSNLNEHPLVQVSNAGGRPDSRYSSARWSPCRKRPPPGGTVRIMGGPAAQTSGRMRDIER